MHAKIIYNVRVAVTVAALAATGATYAQSIGSPGNISPGVRRNGETLTVTWQGKGAVNVYVAASPGAPATARKLVSNHDRDGRHELAATPDARQYIYLEAGDGRGEWVAERVLPLEGGFNFRDLGGYETADGRRVRWGKIFRSGTMVDLTDRDYAYLDRLGVEVVCDFRAVEERLREPTRWAKVDPSVKYTTWDYTMASRTGSGSSMMSARTATQAREAFLDFYRFGSLEFRERYAAMFDDLVKGNAPLAFNCSAGKDRTGRAAALILAALGVPRETIIADYAMTEKVADFAARQRKREADGIRDASGVNAMPAEVRQVLLRSDPEYIRAMLDQMEKDYGSVLGFVQKELGVSDAELARLRELYLES